MASNCPQARRERDDRAEGMSGPDVTQDGCQAWKGILEGGFGWRPSVGVQSGERLNRIGRELRRPQCVVRGHNSDDSRGKLQHLGAIRTLCKRLVRTCGSIRRRRGKRRNSMCPYFLALKSPPGDCDLASFELAGQPFIKVRKATRSSFSASRKSQRPECVVVIRNVR